MGYTTNFTGQFDLDKQLTLDDFNLLNEMADYSDKGRKEGSKNFS